MLGSPTFAQGTILNDDLKSAFTITNATLLTEGNAGTQTRTFAVNLSNPSYQTIEIDYATSSGTATAGSNFVSAGGKLILVAGQIAPQQIIVIINGDRIDEADETWPASARFLPASLRTNRPSKSRFARRNPRLR